MTNGKRGLYNRLGSQKDVRDKEIKRRDENTKRAIFNKSKEKGDSSHISQSRIDDLLGLTDTQRNKQGADKISDEEKSYIAGVIKDRVDPMIICELADENNISLYDLIYLEYILPTDMKNYLTYKQNLERANELEKQREEKRRKEEELRKQKEKDELRRKKDLELKAKKDAEEKLRREEEKRLQEEEQAKKQLSKLKEGLGLGLNKTDNKDETEGSIDEFDEIEKVLESASRPDKDINSGRAIINLRNNGSKDEENGNTDISSVDVDSDGEGINFLKKLKEVGKKVSDERYIEDISEYIGLGGNQVEDDLEDRVVDEVKVIGQDMTKEDESHKKYTSDEEIDALIRRGKGNLTRIVDDNKRKVYLVGRLEDLGLTSNSIPGYSIIEMDTEGKFNNYLSNRESVMVLTRFMTTEVRDALSRWFKGLYDEDTGIVHDKYRVITVDDKDMQLKHDIIECEIPITKETLDEYYDNNPFDNYMKEKKLFPGLDSLL